MPFCEAALPQLSKWEHDKAVTNHYKTKHPKRDTSRVAVCRARAALLRKRKNKAKRLEVAQKVRGRNVLRAAKSRDYGVGGHELVELQVDSLKWPVVRSKKPASFATFLTCARCRGTRRSGHWQLKCPGLRTRPLAAQCALWGRLSMDQRLALATAWKLNMAQANEWFRSSSKGSSSKVTSQEPSDHSIDKSWQKNLVADGDVEPNPGPSSWCGLTLNCGSRDSTWSFVKLVCSRQLAADVVFLQETFLDPSSLSSMTQHAGLSGFRLWTTAPSEVGGQFRGGGAVLVRASIHARLWSVFSARSGQVVAVVLKDVIVASIWRGHSEPSETDDFLGFLGELAVEANAHGLGLVLAGDWNWTPSENVLFDPDDFSLLAMQDNTDFIPTRWQGTRAIDYVLVSSGLNGTSTGFIDEAFGDHKGLLFEIRGVLPEGRCFSRLKTRQYSCPEMLDTARWRQSLREAWLSDEDVFPGNDEINVELEWNWFNAKLERMFSTFVSSSVSCMRAKGSLPTALPASDSRICGFRHGSFKERSLRKLLGRIREANRQFLSRGQCDEGLLRHVHRSWPRDLQWSSWADAESRVVHKLKKTSDESRTARLKEWKETMMQQGKFATRWIHGACSKGPCPDILSPEGLASSTCEEGFFHLKDFWNKIWARPVEIPELLTLNQQKVNEQWRMPLLLEDWIPEVDEFAALARASSGASAGCDGWCGSELAAMPEEVFQTFLVLVQRWSLAGEWPAVWTHVRQVHLRKTNGVGPVRPRDLRPISVLSIWYRCLISATMRKPQTQTWLQNAAPAACHGGIKGRSVTTAIASVLSDLEEGAAALALDYQKCFDMLHPELVLNHLELHRWPPQLLTLFRHVWCGQQCMDSPVPVGSSMPQGDPASPLGLIVVLSQAVQAVENEVNIKQSVFLDDRILIGSSVQQVLRGFRLWKQWSRRLGFVENESKIVALAQNGFQRHAFIRGGLQEHQVQSQIRILGVDFLAATCVDLGNAGSARIDESVKFAQRLARVPLPLNVRSNLFRTRIIPKVSWGWLFRDFRIQDLNRIFKVFRKIAYIHRMASRDLRVLLEGHAFCPRFVAFGASLKALKTAVSLGFCRVGSWPKRVDKVLQEFGWTSPNPLCWWHASEGSIDLVSDNIDQIMHKVRNSWRRLRWISFLNKGRRDSAVLAHFGFNISRYKLAAKAFQVGDNHDRAVLTGAANSSALYQVVIDGQTKVGCDWCHRSDVVSSWRHLGWECPFFADTRPCGDFDLLQQRLGWPSAGASNADAAALRHLAAVRSTVLASTPLRIPPEGADLPEDDC